MSFLAASTANVSALSADKLHNLLIPSPRKTGLEGVSVNTGSSTTLQCSFFTQSILSRVDSLFLLQAIRQKVIVVTLEPYMGEMLKIVFISSFDQHQDR